MSFQSLPSLLPSLSDREAIQDALYRGIIGLDTADATPFDSAFTTDATWDVNDTVLSGLEAIHMGCYDIIAKLDTTHFITNVHINIANAGVTASMTASAMAQHYRQGQVLMPGAANLLTGGIYHLELTKDSDGLWRATHFRMRAVWTEGDGMIAQEK